MRRLRDVDESRSSTRSRSPVRRSSLSESPPRDGSPVNFSAAQDTAENNRDRSLSDDEDEDRSSWKVSSAQYQLFRQAVTSSKGSLKLNPAKSRRAARASLMDLGDGEVTDRVSWLDQPSLTDNMASTARIVQGLKEDEEVKKTTFSESLNTGSSTFKHLTVKQIFPSEPYRLKVHRDAQYLPKPDGFSDTKPPSSYKITHCMSLDAEELARRAAIYASLADSMVTSVIEELLLRTKDPSYCTRSSGLGSICRFRSSLQSAAAMAGRSTQELQFPTASVQWDLHLSGVLMSWVLKPRFSRIGFRPSGRQIGWWVHQLHSFRSPRRAARPTWKRLPQPRRTSRLGLQCLSTWVHLQPRLSRGPYPEVSPFVQVLAEEPRADHSQDIARRLGQLLQLPQPDSVDGVEVGACLADFAPQWRSLLGSCEATNTVEDGVSIAFLQWPQLTHQCISFWARNSRQDLQQAVDALLAKRAIERVGNVTSLGFYSRLILVLKKDRRPSSSNRLVHTEPAHGGSALQDGNSGIRLDRHQNSGVDRLHRHSRCISPCPDAQGRKKVSTFCGQQVSLPVHLSPKVRYGLHWAHAP